jgi:hypothetical protein
MLKRWTAWPPGTRRLVGIAAVVLAAGLVWALFVPLADWLAHHDVGSATGELHETALDNARGRLLTLGAGLVAGGALVFTALNFNLLRRNSEQTDQWQRRTYELTEQGQVTDRFTKAIEQLGSDKGLRHAGHSGRAPGGPGGWPAVVPAETADLHRRVQAGDDREVRRGDRAGRERRAAARRGPV